MQPLGTIYAIAEMTTSGYEDVRKDGDVFVFWGLRFPPEVQAIPLGFWKQVNQLYFALVDGKTDLVCDFLRHYGLIREAETPLFEETVSLPAETIRVVLGYFNALVSLFENATKGNMGYVREVLGGVYCSSEPWAVRLPEGGFAPFLFIYDPPYQPDGYYRLGNDTVLREEVCRVILSETEKWLRRIPWRLVEMKQAKGNVYHAWGFTAGDWVQAAVVSWYIEKVACLTMCECGCGLPALPGRKYASDKCAARHRKRKQRAIKQAGYCPTCGQLLLSSEARRRVGQKAEAEYKRLLKNSLA